ncbi:TPA: hypothetical protein RU617_003871 [Salmonella enterica]|nr:hypothetical protein [Salmonella enterica subsp. enterica serovar Newport]EDM1756936.1 hypothetical protein [Salmonella enterica subsp. diarizonae]HEA0864537.1 hypothetical protein [Salmonella enterica]
MRTSKTKRDVMQLPEPAPVFCITFPRMNLEQYAKQSGQTLRAVQHQADNGKFVLAEGKYGKYREINMVAEFMKEYEAAIRALKQTA